MTKFTEEWYQQHLKDMAARTVKAEVKPKADIKPKAIKAKPKGSEYEEQCLIFAWADSQIKKYPELNLMFATLNGIKLTMGLAVKAKKAGMRQGVVDIWLPVGRGGFLGLAIELKIKGNYPTPEQKNKINHLRCEGWEALVIYGADETIIEIEHYLCHAKTVALDAETYKVLKIADDSF